MDPRNASTGRYINGIVKKNGKERPLDLPIEGFTVAAGDDGKVALSPLEEQHAYDQAALRRDHYGLA